MMSSSSSTTTTTTNQRPNGCPPSTRRTRVSVVNANRILKASIPIGNDKTVELIGRSWAADCTAFVVPALDLALDAGYPVHGRRMKSVFITHTHTDHCHHVTHLKSRSKPPDVYLPLPSVPRLEHFIDVAQQLTSNLTPEQYADIAWDTCYVPRGVQPGNRLIVNEKRGLICHVVSCDHTVPCVGFCFSQRKCALKPEFRGLPGREIGKLRKEGVEVTEETEQPLFCFLGDTTASILRDGPDAERILACPTVIIECSFLTDDCRENATRSKHVLWSDLRPHVVSHPDTTFVLTHFSHRWSTEEVGDFFAREDLPNVVPWIPSSNQAGLHCWPVGEEQEKEEPPIDEVWSHF